MPARSWAQLHVPKVVGAGEPRSGPCQREQCEGDDRQVPAWLLVTTGGDPNFQHKGVRASD